MISAQNQMIWVLSFAINKNDIGKHISNTDPAEYTSKTNIGYRPDLQTVIIDNPRSTRMNPLWITRYRTFFLPLAFSSSLPTEYGVATPAIKRKSGKIRS